MVIIWKVTFTPAYPMKSTIMSNFNMPIDINLVTKSFTKAVDLRVAQKAIRSMHA